MLSKEQAHKKNGIHRLCLIPSHLFGLPGTWTGGGPRFKLGVGSYSVMVAEDEGSSSSKDELFYGGALVGTLCLNQHLALRAVSYSAEHEDISSLDVDGYDLQLLLGTSFYEGWNFFGGLGSFSEKWEMEYGPLFEGSSQSINKRFSGAEVSLGLGYSWKKVSLDYVLNIRETDDYKDHSKKDHDFALSCIF